MQCPRCHAENREGRRFCAECGVSLALACPSCGFSNEGGEKFCGGCAAPLASLRATAESKFASPQSYTPKHLAEKILTSKAAMEGERKLVTILFADMKGSMELLADRDPEEAHRILDPVLGRMMEAVHRYEGTVNQVMGDGIMALFGAPLAHEDHAVRACYAALRMQEAIAGYANESRGTQGLDVQIRIGLNSGEVVVRSIGSDLRMDYTAVGQTTHLAARMEQLARPGATLLTAATVRLVEGYVQVKPLGRVPIKGFPEPVEVYELTGAAAARTRFQAAKTRGLTRFVGRDAEVEVLRRVLGQADAGHGQVVAIVGEAGVGKSRLVYEFTHSHHVCDWTVLEATSVSYGKATSYLPVIDLLKTYFKIGDRDNHREMYKKVLARVLGLDRALEPLLTPLLALLDVPVEDSAWQVLDPPRRRQRTLDAVKRLLLRESRVQPLLVVFEDLHWIDGETQALLHSLVDSLGPARLLLLVNYRPEYDEHRWGSKTYYSQVRLDTLPVESTTELLGALLGADLALDPLKRMLIKRGNPFFLEETVRTLVETGALEGHREAYRLLRPVDALQVPDTVQVVLAARMDRLPPEEKQLLQAASVIGKDVPSTILSAIAEQPEEILRRGLGHLQESEFLYETQIFPDPEYTFKHALTHEVAYGSLLQERRRALHVQIVEAIERLFSDRLNEQAERLVHHAVKGETWDKAVRYSQRAGVKASSRSAYREAVAYYEQALAGLRHLPETRETREQAIDLRFGLRIALSPLGELGRMSDYLREAEELAKILGDHRRLALATVYRSFVSWQSDRATDARAFAQNAHLLAQRLRDVNLDVASYLALGVASHQAGDYRAAVEFLGKAITLVGKAKIREHSGLLAFPAVMARAYTAHAHAECGAFPEGITCGREALALAEQFQQPWSFVIALLALAHLHVQQGDFDVAIPLLERALGSSREWEFPFLTPLVTASLAHAYVMSGRVDEGWILLEPMLTSSAISQQSDRQRMFRLCDILLLLGEVCLAVDRFGPAHDFASRALELARDGGVRGMEARALHLLAGTVARCDPKDTEIGEARSRESLALAEELGMRPLVAHCHLTLGKLYRRTDYRDQAQERLTRATVMYREMDMRFWLEKACDPKADEFSGR